MECNAIRQAVCANEVVYDSVVEVPLENDVILPDYCPDIVKVLKCTVNACVSSTQVQGRQMTLGCVPSIFCIWARTVQVPLCSCAASTPECRTAKRSI